MMSFGAQETSIFEWNRGKSNFDVVFCTIVRTARSSYDCVPLRKCRRGAQTLELRMIIDPARDHENIPAKAHDKCTIIGVAHDHWRCAYSSN